MKQKKLLKKLERRRNFLNFLLRFLPPTCIITVKLSQNLDFYVHRYQNYLARKYRKKCLKPYDLLNKKVA